MQIPVLIEQVAGNGYRAQPLSFTAEGATVEEALCKLREFVQGRLAAGAQIVPLELQATEKPWLRSEGIFKDDPLFDEWQQAIADYRQQVEEDPNAR